jgi:hypothetical protein
VLAHAVGDPPPVSDFEGGFILERTDPGVAPIAYDVVRTYLSRHDGGPVGPIGHLAHELGSWEAAESNVWIVQAPDAPLDPALLADHLRAFEVPRPRPSPDLTTLSVFLMQSVLADAAKLAASATVDLGSVFAAPGIFPAWSSPPRRRTTRVHA